METLLTAEFWAMDGQAAFVWSSYGLTAAVLGALALASVIAMRRREARLAALEAARGRRREGG